MSERALGCHCDLEPGQQPTGCVLDGHEPVENCSVAMRLRAEGKSQAQCEHWRPVQPSEVEQLRSEVERLRMTDAEREAVVAADSELSAIAHHRTPDKRECLRISTLLRGLLARHTDHDGAPAATAKAGMERRDNPPVRPGDGTGDTPTLTDAEREAVQWAIEVGDSLAECSGAGTGGAPSPEAAALRALLARLGGVL